MASNALAFPQNNNIVAQRAGLQPQGTAIARPMPVMNGPGSMQAPGMQNPVMQRPMPVMQPQPQPQMQNANAPGMPPAGNALQNPLAQNFMRSRMMGMTQ
jgi:hypothetical protein